MTRGEAADFLEKCRWWFEPFTSEKEQWNEALDIAVEALTQDSRKVTQDLISRQNAIDALGEKPDIWNDTEEEWAYRNAWVEHISAIKSLPSADRPTGEWVLANEQRKEDTENDNYRYICSNCNHSDIHSKTQEVPFCWHCGAYMGGNTK